MAFDFYSVNSSFSINYLFPGIGERAGRLRAVREQMTRQSANTRIHFEMASFTDPELMQDLFTYVVPYADSLGMNEQVYLFAFILT